MKEPWKCGDFFRQQPFFLCRKLVSLLSYIYAGAREPIPVAESVIVEQSSILKLRNFDNVEGRFDNCAYIG